MLGCVATACLVIGPDASPGVHGLDLAFEHAAGCPGQTEFREKIGESLSSESLEGPPVQARVKLTSQDAGFRLDLEILAPSGTETTRLVGPICGTLADVASLKIAMALDSTRVVVGLGTRLPVPASTPESAEGSVGLPKLGGREEPDEPASSAPASRKRSPGLFALFASAGLALGAMPHTSMVVGLGGAWVRAKSRIEMGALFWPPSGKQVADGGVGGRFRMVGGHVDACLVAGWPKLRLPMWGGVELASMRGEGLGVRVPQAARRLWAAVRVQQRLVWLPRPGLGFVLQPGVALAVFRPGFEFDDGRVVHRARRVELRVLAGIEVRLP